MTGLTFGSLDDTAPIGAMVRGFDPHGHSERDREAVWDAYRSAHGLLCFDFDRLLEVDELHELTSVFGEREYAPGVINGLGKKSHGDEAALTLDEQLAALEAAGRDPFMVFLGNRDRRTGDKAELPELFFGEWEWHTDMSYVEVPPTFSLLHAREVPSSGGRTGFCSQVMAAKDLPPELRARVEGKQIKHDSTYGSSGILRPGMSPPASPIEAEGWAHPILRRVPTTGDEAIFLGRRTNGYVTGLSLPDSEALLDDIWAHATAERFTYLHDWNPGQVVVWDNRMLLHRREPFDAQEIRWMWRTQTKGEAVVAA